MDSLKQSMAEMTETFNTRMAGFQKLIEKAAPNNPTIASVSAEFHTFKLFIKTTLEAMQKQIQLLSMQLDQQDMRSRRKMLLLHGVPEAEQESTLSLVELLNGHLEEKLTVNDVKRCHRLGQPRKNINRCILVKFSDVSVRNSVWFDKKRLKGSGVTLSEFLTKPRHEVFMAARERLGVRRCWTRDGNVYVLDAADKRHCVTSVAEVEQFPAADTNRALESASSGSGSAQEQTRRSRKPPKKN
ncbi:uncharacterized protein LOC133521947 [Cydia pomonella]|uniref:uncharacterized protein LOC133521947 n=1 Tax=Cydia pomonella TaxID=82600 RepID=UPI002ADE8823|nr:uncharacterized protein LOC133521947 [Cydia pomonella]